MKKVNNKILVLTVLSALALSFIATTPAGKFLLAAVSNATVNVFVPGSETNQTVTGHGGYFINSNIVSKNQAVVPVEQRPENNAQNVATNNITANNAVNNVVENYQPNAQNLPANEIIQPPENNANQEEKTPIVNTQNIAPETLETAKNINLYPFIILGIILIIICPVIYIYFKYWIKNKSKQKSKNIMATQNSFACAINCMDGRVQDAVKNYMKEKYGVDYVDMVTEPGPNKILASPELAEGLVENIKKRVEVSVHHHGSKVIAIVGHFGCAGNPTEKAEQIQHLKKAEETVKAFGFDAEITLLWVDGDWSTIEQV